MHCYLDYDKYLFRLNVKNKLPMSVVRRDDI